MPEVVHPDGRAHIDAALVKRLIATQFPQWSGLSVVPVEVDGWDNRTYRLGTDMTVRLPTADHYAPAIDKEHRWLPVLAPPVPVEIPVCLAKGKPSDGFPYNWSVRNWITGETADHAHIPEEAEFATQVGEFLRALQRVDPTGGPVAGVHSFYRGAPPAHYDGETRRVLEALAGRIDTTTATAVWAAALSATWTGRPVWFHGDVATGNLLARNGRLVAVIDFGTCGVGDPACDLVIAWTRFSGESREAFRHAVRADDGTWARARGWALWKALIGLAEHIDTDAQRAAINRRVIQNVLADHKRST
ncbi:aminoglycoside phosphotransferase family protein [Jatrophihabitans lederbergiae]|uniref:Aminoglycoside phosphotransferase family protein n=1 Tax=Jatrophihabitans lederbergiae TaxID=3075547 RepID=A0ABU2JC80_9ACTN|nr:aminoglycoside phosphotransferase family protein [Jatrophihabitans sp. DSM 44399]MDT0262592.1 aminoglycoside phosphotransferase family protein [Jatrophihabitans sp. DSM 44399]